jgi:hypothetical protein
VAFPLSPLPDDELALIQYLRGVTEVTALIPAARITTELPPTPTYPVVLIQRMAGLTLTWGIDEPALQVDVVGGTKHQCKALTQTVRSAILAIANDTVAEAVLVSAEEETGPAWLPDTIPTPPLPRYTFRVRLLLHR